MMRYTVLRKKNILLAYILSSKLTHCKGILCAKPLYNGIFLGKLWSWQNNECSTAKLASAPCFNNMTIIV